MDLFFYAVALPMAVLFFAFTVYALYWSSKHGQLREEPIGQPTDSFPGKMLVTKPPVSKS